MWISMALLFIFSFWAIILWRSSPPLISESELESDEFGYCYTTTPQRRLTVMLTSCAVFTLLFWIVTYAIGYLVWNELVGSLVNGHQLIKLFLFLFIAGAVVAISQLPKPKQFLMDVCVFFQRHQFFPVLPSRKEGKLMDQIARLPMDNVPEEIQRVLGEDPMLFNNEQMKVIYKDYHKLEVIHMELEQLAKKHRGIIRRIYFGTEWELIESQFQFIDRQMHSNTTDVDGELVKKIRLCLYYSYGLFTRVIMETSSTPEESAARFKQFGFSVEV